MKNPKFTELADIHIERFNDVVIVKHNKRRNNPNSALLCAAHMLRVCLSWATLSSVWLYVVKDMDGRFVCFSLYVGKSFPADESLENYLIYLRNSGFQKDIHFDYRETFFHYMKERVSKIHDRKWRTINHRSARW